MHDTLEVAFRKEGQRAAATEEEEEWWDSEESEEERSRRKRRSGLFAALLSTPRGSSHGLRVSLSSSALSSHFSIAATRSSLDALFLFRLLLELFLSLSLFPRGHDRRRSAFVRAARVSLSKRHLFPVAERERHCFRRPSKSTSPLSVPSSLCRYVLTPLNLQPQRRSRRRCSLGPKNERLKARERARKRGVAKTIMEGRRRKTIARRFFSF